MRTIMIALMMLSLLGADKPMNDVIDNDAKVEKLAGGMQFVEGPVWTNADDGHLVFSDIPDNRLRKWDGEELSIFREFSHNANGNTRDRQGRLITCEHSSRVVTRQEGSTWVTLVSKFEGKRF